MVRFFRKSFSVTSVPAAATLYVAGPYNWDIAINGQSVTQSRSGGPSLAHDRPVAAVDVSANLTAGENTVTIETWGSEVLAFKIVPAAEGVDVPALVLSDGAWDGSLDGNSWSRVSDDGSIEADAVRFKDNFDLNMYRWPGYRGITRLLDRTEIEPVAVTVQAADTILLDFGREMFGRILATQSTGSAVRLELNYGESAGEASPDYSSLGPRDLVVPSGIAAHGPLTGFRYVQVRVVNASPDVLHLSAEQFLRRLPVVHPFTSSDPELKKIWEVSAYTAQLGMQTEFFDGVKRDRNPFAGDLFVSARAARAVFGHATDRIVEDTLADLLHRVCITQYVPISGRDINCIPGYNACWIASLSDLYRYNRDLEFLKGQRDNIIEILRVMRSEMSGGLYQSSGDVNVFSDWAPGMFQLPGQNAPEAVKITTMSYYLAFREAAFLFGEMAEPEEESSAQDSADEIKAAVLGAYFDPVSRTFGDRVQTNAMAIFSGIAEPGSYESIFSKVLNTAPQAGTPYFYYFVLEAMEKSGHHAEAIHLVRDVWGGMLAAGATSFWELWDPRCSADPDPHRCVVGFANSMNYQERQLWVSLAHGWSSGPAAFLAEH